MCGVLLQFLNGLAQHAAHNTKNGGLDAPFCFPVNQFPCWYGLACVLITCGFFIKLCDIRFSTPACNTGTQTIENFKCIESWSPMLHLHW